MRPLGRRFCLAAIGCALAAAVAAAQTPRLVRDINPGGGGSPFLWSAARVNAAVLFFADDGVHGMELWKSDGTTVGTVLVEDINRGASDSVLPTNPVIVVNGTMFFGADDGVHGHELWKSDGTGAGTSLVKDVRPGSNGSHPGWLSAFVSVDGTVFFFADDGVHGNELWKTDGTDAGTALVADIVAGAGSPNVFDCVASNGTVYFAIDDGTHGGELWRSNGTAAGTRLVKDIVAGATGSDPGPLTNVNGTLFFDADDGMHGRELWKSDGSAAGTLMVKDIHSGTGSSIQPYSWGSVTTFGGLFYFAGSDGEAGHELWSSDGTPQGTLLVKDINPGAGDSLPRDFADINGTLWFEADDGTHGVEPWTSDGTADGTLLVRDVNVGLGSSGAIWFTGVGASVYFSANDPMHGQELWKSNGTAAGTVLVADLNPAGSSDAFPLASVGGMLFFAADDGIRGRELWKVPLAPVLNPLSGAVTVGGTNTLAGVGFTAGSVIKLFVATSSGAAAFGPYTPTSRTGTSLTWNLPATVPLGNGFGSLQVINTDDGYPASNIVGALLEGDPADNIPTILAIDGVPLAAVAPGIAVAHVDTVVAKGAVVTLVGTGFNHPLVSLFTATGNVGPLSPLAGGTATTIRVTVPVGAPTGPANFQVVNAPYSGTVISNAVSAVIGAVPNITTVTVVGTTVTVVGTGFSPLSVINLFNKQGSAVVNLGGLGPGGPLVPLTLVSDSQFTFTRPAGAVAGPAFVEVLNPPYIPFSSSGNDPDGAFTMP